LDSCTKPVVSARACANQFLPYSSSGIALFGMRTVQTDICLNYEQNGTLLISLGGQEGGFGGWVVILGRRPKIWTCLSTIFFTPPDYSKAMCFLFSRRLHCRLFDLTFSAASLPCHLYSWIHSKTFASAFLLTACGITLLAALLRLLLVTELHVFDGQRRHITLHHWTNWTVFVKCIALPS
jgi:hypothetical protein